MITALVDSIKDVVSRISEKPAGTDISAELSEWRKKHTELGILDATMLVRRIFSSHI